MADQILLGLSTIAFTIALGFAADLFFNKTKVPDVIWLIVFGIILGPILGVLAQERLFGIAPLFTAIAITLILFESGRKMKVGELLRDAPISIPFMIANLATAIVLVAIGTKFIFGMEFGTALLLGVIVAGTSSPMIVTIVDRLGINRKLKTILSIESIINSPFVIVIGIVLMEGLASSRSVFSFGNISSNIVKNFAVSIMLGLGIGLIWSRVLYNLEKYKYHHMMTISVLFLTYALSQYFGGSGAMAVLVMGITIGNITSLKILGKKMAGLTAETKDFNALIAFVIRTLFFVFLGAIAGLTNYKSIGIGLALTALLLIARFIVVYPTSKIINLSKREIITAGFMIPTGLSAAVLAVISSTQYHIAGTENFVDIVFTIIISTTIFATVSVGIVEYLYNRKGAKKKTTKLDNIKI
ncbi:MAG: cation:proton antiporter [Nanoarchaeota archaeon]|nr:cation:proton antiporter [Nanoarchaeota archaeon]